jgi:Fe-S-cluster-containing hydrogenase component 2
VLVVDKEKCEGCEVCTTVCATGAAKMVDGKAEIDPDECVECYACKDVCPQEAIEEKD